MKWFFWIGVSNIGIFWIEYVYRKSTYSSFLEALPYIFAPILIGQIGLFYGFRSAPNLLVAGATFTLINITLRVVNSYRLGETLNVYNWMGVACLIIAMLLLKVK